MTRNWHQGKKRTKARGNLITGNYSIPTTSSASNCPIALPRRIPNLSVSGITRPQGMRCSNHNSSLASQRHVHKQDYLHPKNSNTSSTNKWSHSTGNLCNPGHPSDLYLAPQTNPNIYGQETTPQSNSFGYVFEKKVGILATGNACNVIQVGSTRRSIARRAYQGAGTNSPHLSRLATARRDPVSKWRVYNEGARANSPPRPHTQTHVTRTSSRGDSPGTGLSDCRANSSSSAEENLSTSTPTIDTRCRFLVARVFVHFSAPLAKNYGLLVLTYSKRLNLTDNNSVPSSKDNSFFHNCVVSAAAWSSCL